MKLKVVVKIRMDYNIKLITVSINLS